MSVASSLKSSLELDSLSSSSPASSSSSPPSGHRSRPSLAISYSQAPPRTVPITRDPTYPAAVAVHRRPHLTFLESSQPMSLASTSSTTTTQKFVAPAHPQSHHLHSLPPREKTTRTLILDHTAWRHGRTRFAQGRCELGMKVRLKGKEKADDTKPGLFYVGGSDQQPRRFSDFGEPLEVDVASSDDDDDDAAGFFESEGEGVKCLSYGKYYKDKSGNAMDVDQDEENSDNEDDEDDESRPDELAAPALAARAAGMEKVLAAMLQQQPEYRSDVTQTLPNGLRLRLALLTLINNLFIRDPCSSSDSPKTPMSSPSAGLAALLQVSSQPFFAPPTLPSFRTLSLPSSSGRGFGATPPPPSPLPFGGSSATSRPHPPLYAWSRSQASQEAATTPTAPSPSTNAIRVKHPPDLPSSWMDHSLTLHGPNSSTNKLSVPTVSRRAAGRSKDLFNTGCYGDPSTSTTINTFRTDVPTFSYRASSTSTGTSTTSPTNTTIPGFPRERLKKLCPRHLHQSCRTCEPTCDSSSPPSTRIGAGLLKSYEVLLMNGKNTTTTTTTTTTPTNANNKTGGVLADLLPTFLRLSALIAVELGREARGEEPEAADISDGQPQDVDMTESPSTSTHALPTRAWFALLSGLITRAVLEGYVARGWKGAEYVEVLMGIGVGIKGVGTHPDAEGNGDKKNSTAKEVPSIEDEKSEFDPDGMPGLVEACKVLFAGLVKDAAAGASTVEKEKEKRTTRDAEREYVAEMEGRMSEFLVVPHTCPDLGTHMTRLSNKYPAEPIERAALRFCEAVSKWRGKPELEMYKKSQHFSSKDSTPALSIHALLASPTPHLPPIYKYFTVPRRRQRQQKTNTATAVTTSRHIPSPAARKPTSSPSSSSHHEGIVAAPARGLKRQRSLKDEEDVRRGVLKKEKVDGVGVGVGGDEMDVDDEGEVKVEEREDSAGTMGEVGVVEDAPTPVPGTEWVGPYGV